MRLLSAVLLMVASLLGGGCDGCSRGASSMPPASASGVVALKEAADLCAGRRDITFLMASDTHYGHAAETEARNLESIRQMNAIEDVPFPAELGGTVGKPCGVLVSGDLTEDGKPEEWDKFVKDFGHKGGDGALAFPVFETLGNHDKHYGFHVRNRIYERHGRTVYSFDWGPIHVVSLGEAPDDDDLAWLKSDLASAEPGARIVIYFHFPLQGPYSNNWFGDGHYRDRFEETIKGHKILGVFHGHYHATGLYRWRGVDVYRAGSPKHSWHTFNAVRIVDDTMKTAAWDYDNKRWVWWHMKSIEGTGPEVRHADPNVPP